MTEQDATQWGEDEARMALSAYRMDTLDLGATEALLILRRRRDHAASYIDVPRAWQAYIARLGAHVPEQDAAWWRAQELQEHEKRLQVRIREILTEANTP